MTASSPLELHPARARGAASTSQVRRPPMARNWPGRTRFIARAPSRCTPAPSAPLVGHSELWRYRGFYTDADTRPRRARRPHASPRTNRRTPSPRSKRLSGSQTMRLQCTSGSACAACPSDVQLGEHLTAAAGEMVPTTAPAGLDSAQAAPKRLRWQLWHGTRPSPRALLKKMDPAPARLVARHSATICTPATPAPHRHPPPLAGPSRRQNSHPARPHTQTRATKQPQQDAQPQHAPPTQPNQQTRHPKSYEKTQTRTTHQFS